MTEYLTPENFETIIPPDCISGLHLNIRNLRKHYHDLSYLLTSLKRRTEFIALTETLLAPHEIGLYSLSGYNTEASCRNSNDQRCHAGGASLFISEEISYKKRLALSLNVEKCESVWIRIKKGLNFAVSSDIDVGDIYR